MAQAGLLQVQAGRLPGAQVVLQHRARAVQDVAADPGLHVGLHGEDRASLVGDRRPGVLRGLDRRQDQREVVGVEAGYDHALPVPFGVVQRARQRHAAVVQQRLERRGDVQQPLLGALPALPEVGAVRDVAAQQLRHRRGLDAPAGIHHQQQAHAGHGAGEGLQDRLAVGLLLVAAPARVLGIHRLQRSLDGDQLLGDDAVQRLHEALQLLAFMLARHAALVVQPQGQQQPHAGQGQTQPEPGMPGPAPGAARAYGDR